MFAIALLSTLVQEGHGTCRHSVNDKACAAHVEMGPRLRLLRGFEELDRIAVGIFQLNLFSSGS